MDDIIGLAGMALIIIAWIPEIAQTIKKRQAQMKIEFIVIYFFGSALLAYSAWRLNYVPFLILNVIAATIPLINLFFYRKDAGK